MTDRREMAGWAVFLAILAIFSSAGAWRVLNDHRRRIEALEGAAPVTSSVP